MRRSPKTDEQRPEFVPLYRPFIDKIPIPEAGICDAPNVGMCISTEWMPIIRGLFAVLDQPDIWDTTDPDEIFAVRQQIKELMTMGNCLCGYSESLRIVINNTDLTYNTQLVQIFLADGLDGVAPDRPDTAFDEDSGDTGQEIIDRHKAMCAAVHDYVITVVQKGIFDSFLPDAVTLLATGVISFLLTPLAGIVYRTGVQIMETLINMVANKPSIIELVTCCMVEGLEGKAITEANFATALDGCGFGALSDEAFVADAVKMGLDDTGNFLAFVRTLDDYNNMDQEGYECPCQEEVCAVDFTIDDGGFEAQSGGPLAIYDAGLGWDNGPVGTSNHRIHILFFLSEDIAMTEAGFSINWTGDRDLLWELFLHDDTSIIHQEEQETGPEVSEVNWEFSEVTGVKRIRFTIVTTTGLQSDFEGHIVEGHYTGDICDFPAQS